jgi:hypothetical protein
LTFIVLNSNFSIAQNDFYVTPGGVLDKVFDRYGTSYALVNLQKNSNTNASTHRFQVYYETGSGMENNSNSIHLARRQVLEKYLKMYLIL